MYGVVGMICMSLCSTAPADSATPSQFFQPIELVSTEFEKIPAGEFVTSKRIAPQPSLVEFIDEALKPGEPPPPALPSSAAGRIATAKVVVDEILKLKPAMQQTISDATQTDQPVTIPSRHRVSELVESTQEISAETTPSVVDLTESKSNLFVVPDPTDDQFITNPQPISIELQDQLKSPEPLVETVVEEVVKSAETSTEQLTQPEETPNTVLPAEPVKPETITVQTADQVVDSPAENQLLEVKQSWTSLNETTRQAILMLVEADLMTHQLTTQQ